MLKIASMCYLGPLVVSARDLSVSKYPVPYQQNGKGPYWIAYQINGTRKKIGLKTRDRVEAERLSARLLDRAHAEATLERLAKGKVPGKAKNMPLDYAINRFWNDHVIANLAAHSEIERRLDVINKAIGPDVMVTDIDDEVIKAYKKKREAHISERTKRLLSANTIHGELAEIQRLLVYARDALKIPNMPVIDWRRIKTPEAKRPKRTRILSPAEIILIRSKIGADYGPLIDMACATGLRLHGFTGLRWSNIHSHTRTIQLLIKGQRVHSIHITSEIEAILEAASVHRTDDPDAPIFTFKDGGKRRPVTYWGFQTQWRRAIEGLNIPHATPHDLRRTYVTDYVASTGDLVAASKAVGHTSTRVTEAVYVHLPSPHVRAASEKAAKNRVAARVGALSVS